MRIAIFTEVMSPYVCGISSYVDVLRKGLLNQGHDVVIVTSSLRVSQATIKGGVVRCPARKAANKYGYECKDIHDKHVMRLLDRFKPEIVHIQTDTRIGYMGLVAADRYMCPVVFTVHDYFPDRFASHKSKLVWNVRTFFEKKHFCDMIDNAQVITSSNKRAQKFVRDAGRNRAVTMIPTATDKKRFDYKNLSREAVAKLRRRLKIPSNAVIAVFAGELSVEKNLEFVISAFSKFISPAENIHLLIVGDGTELSYLKNTARRLKVSDRVHFTGKVAHSIMPQIFSACDVYVCSSEDGLMSMSFLEAMACGLPVLVKEDGEEYVHNMIRSGVNGFTYKTRSEFAGYLKKVASFPQDKKEQMKYIVRSSIRTRNATYMAICMEKAYAQAIKAHKINLEIR